MDIGSIFGKAVRGIASTLTGGLSEAVLGIVDEVVGEGLPPEQKALIKAKVMEEETKRRELAMQEANEAERNVTARAAELEGTAKDLLAAGWLGRVVLFARGCQRPVWGFAAIAIDYQVFSGAWAMPESGPLPMAFWTLNVLVLGFLFGERAVQNILPLVTQFMEARKTPAK